MTNRLLIVLSAMLVAAPVLGAATAYQTPVATLSSEVGEVVTIVDEAGHVIYEISVEPSNPDLMRFTHYLRHAELGAKPGGGGSGGNDCASTAYKLAGWQWTGPYSAYATAYASVFNSAANTWDSATGASISGGISSGSRGTAGTYDGVNQIDFVRLSNTGTIAVTTTWYYRGSGEAVESDGQYNTYFSWSTSGDANSMDVQSIATHEIGHTFGLDHPTTTSANQCLTMYAYYNNGLTYARTLGAGDILGIRAIYGT